MAANDKVASTPVPAVPVVTPAGPAFAATSAAPPDAAAMAVGLKAGDWSTLLPGLGAAAILLALVFLRRRGVFAEYLTRRTGLDALRQIVEPLASPAGEVSRLAASTLEDLPEIRDRIVALWGQPGGTAYMENLLREGNADPQRSLGLPVVQEILFLLDLSAAREAD